MVGTSQGIGGDPHAGLWLAQRMSLPEGSELEAMMEWARGEIDRLGITLDGDKYDKLSRAIDGIIDVQEDRIAYFRFIFHECVTKARELSPESG